MRFSIYLTWSKIMALLILGCAFYLDIKNGGISSFMYALPFIVAMIGGKQAVDYMKEKK